MSACHGMTPPSRNLQILMLTNDAATQSDTILNNFSKHFRSDKTCKGNSAGYLKIITHFVRHVLHTCEYKVNYLWLESFKLKHNNDDFEWKVSPTIFIANFFECLFNGGLFLVRRTKKNFLRSWDKWVWWQKWVILWPQKLTFRPTVSIFFASSGFHNLIVIKVR
jgi:hypothetical protein